MKRITVNLSDKTGTALKTKATKAKRSMASEAAVAIEKHLSKHSTKEKQP